MRDVTFVLADLRRDATSRRTAARFLARRSSDILSRRVRSRRAARFLYRRRSLSAASDGDSPAPSDGGVDGESSVDPKIIEAEYDRTGRSIENNEGGSRPPDLAEVEIEAAPEADGRGVQRGGANASAEQGNDDGGGFRGEDHARSARDGRRRARRAPPRRPREREDGPRSIAAGGGRRRRPSRRLGIIAVVPSRPASRSRGCLRRFRGAPSPIFIMELHSNLQIEGEDDLDCVYYHW
mmetsp:Transcript_43371/g.131940  ORF Transcript_43371/g.131940 Transcript_43371/m.131940 type:complete len:238 (-) Transcript_43371:64-777(-)